MIDSEINKQFFTQLAKAKRVLIALPASLNADIAGAASALALFIKRLEKEAEVFASENYEEDFKFLPKTGALQTALSPAQSLVVVVDTSKKILEEISYSQETGKAKIFLKGKNEIFTPQEIIFETEKAPYDLAIILGAQSLEDLGSIFEQNPDVFYDTPKVNIDNHPGNKQFGAINLIDINAASLSEIVTQLLQEFETDLVDEEIATCLLSGIIARTNSFQHPQVTPKSFLQASMLIEKGARQQEIVRALFKTRPLPLLKLWGRSLARLKDWDQAALTAITQNDFEKSEASLSFLPQVLHELLENLSGKAIIGLLAEDGRDCRLLLAVRRGFEIERLNAEFGGGEKLKQFTYGPYEVWQYDISETSMASAESRVTDLIVGFLPQLS